MSLTRHDRERRQLLERFPAAAAGLSRAEYARLTRPCACAGCEAERTGQPTASGVGMAPGEQRMAEQLLALADRQQSSAPATRAATLTELMRLINAGLLSADQIAGLLRAAPVLQPATRGASPEPTRSLRVERQFE